MRIDFRGRFATDLRAAEAPLRYSNTSRFDIARRRIGVSGDVGRVAEFQVEREMADEGGWRDVYVNFHRLSSDSWDDSLEIARTMFPLLVNAGVNAFTLDADPEFVAPATAEQLAGGDIDAGLTVYPGPPERGARACSSTWGSLSCS